MHSLAHTSPLASLRTRVPMAWVTRGVLAIMFGAVGTLTVFFVRHYLHEQALVAYASADAFSSRLSLLLLVLLAGLFLVSSWLHVILIERPLGSIRQTAVQIAKNEDRLGDCVPQPFGRELADLVEAFNDLSVGLRVERDGLEKRVARRTAELEQVTAGLRRRTEELERTEADLRQRIAERDEAQALLLAQAASVSQINDALAEQAALLDLTNEAIMVCEMSGPIRFWNRAAERMYGWPAAEAIGRHVHDVLHTRFPGSRYEAYHEVRDTGHWEGDLIQVCRDGREITVASRWASVRGPLGEPEATLEINTDVTAERDAQRESAYQAYLLSKVNDAVVACDATGAITVWNCAAEAMYGWAAGEAIGKDIVDLPGLGLHQENADKIGAHLREAGSWRGEVEAHHRGGSPFTADVNLIALFDEGELRGYVGVARDITERRAMEETLREKEELLQLQFERMPVACIVWTSDFRVQSWNPAAERMFGFSFDEVVGKRGVGLILPEELGSSLDRWWQSVVSREGTTRGTNKNLTKDGRIITCEWSCTALRNERGEVRGVLAMASDITQQKEVELVLREERERMARELHDSVTQSLYSLTLFGDAGRQQAAGGNLERASHYLSRISETAVQALKEMRLLVYQLRPADVENEGLVGALEHRLNAVERRAGVKAELICNPDISIPASMADRFYRLAQEALNNVVKHSYATQVTVELVRNDGHAKLIVTDNGLGFEESGLREGGFGLVSMRERAEKLGGTLTIRSAPHEGTTITVIAPLPSSGNMLAV